MLSIESVKSTSIKMESIGVLWKKEHYLTHENKVNKKVLSYYEALGYMLIHVYKHN